MQKILQDNPLVSICIPAYNCDKYIQETLNCLCNQTYSNIEIIVVNDGSTDQTEGNAKKNTDSRITLLNVINGGAAKARNIAYKHAHGQYIIFFDADDYVKPDFVSSQLNKIGNNKDIIVLSAWGRFYNNDINTFRKVPLPYDEMSLEDWINYYWYNCNPMTNPGRIIIPKMLIEEAGLWNEGLSLNDDLEFYTRLFLKSKKIIFNHNTIFYYRSGIKGLSAKKGLEANKSLFNSIQISTELILKHYNNKISIRQGCANLWQGSIHLLYPEEKAMIKVAEKKIKDLGGSNLSYRSGGYTKFLTSILGWKLTILIKKIFKDG